MLTLDYRQHCQLQFILLPQTLFRKYLATFVFLQLEKVVCTSDDINVHYKQLPVAPANWQSMLFFRVTNGTWFWNEAVQRNTNQRKRTNKALDKTCPEAQFLPSYKHSQAISLPWKTKWRCWNHIDDTLVHLIRYYQHHKIATFY